MGEHFVWSLARSQRRDLRNPKRWRGNMEMLVRRRPEKGVVSLVRLGKRRGLVGKPLEPLSRSGGAQEAALGGLVVEKYCYWQVEASVYMVQG